MFLDLSNLAVTVDLATALIWLGIVFIPGIFAATYEIVKRKKDKKAALLKSQSEDQSADGKVLDEEQTNVEEFSFDDEPQKNLKENGLEAAHMQPKVKENLKDSEMSE